MEVVCEKLSHVFAASVLIALLILDETLFKWILNTSLGLEHFLC